METMKLTSSLFVVWIIVPALAISLAAPLNATPQIPEGFATAPASYIPRLWTNSDKIDDLKDILFDFDAQESTSDQAILQTNALWLKDLPNVRVRLAGYSDSRGDIVHNLLLSQKRADTVRQQLVALGVDGSRIVFATGWGELYPNCLESTEECCKRNPRVEFLLAIY